MAVWQRLRDRLSGERISRGRGVCKSPSRRRLDLEPLEERMLLATIPTLTTLSASTTAVVPGATTLLTATVTGVPSTSGMPTGTVRFVDETTSTDLATVTLTNGTAVCPYRFLETTAALGFHEVAAYYSGDADFFASSAQPGAKSTIVTVVNQLHLPAGIASDSNGNLYIANAFTNQIVMVNPTTYTSTVIAGSGVAGYSGDGGPATEATLYFPHGLALENDQYLFIADHGNHCVRQVDLTTGIITTVAGVGGSGGYNGDDIQATTAQLYYPDGLAVTTDQLLYIADYANHRVRCVDLTTGIITTVAGDGTQGYGGDGGLATAAQINLPSDVEVDSSGNLYLVDAGNNRIREVVLATGIITTVAGTGIAGYSGDGGLATEADLNTPAGIALDSSGNLYIADLSNCRIRTVEATTGVISTVAGTGVFGYSGDGGLAGSARLGFPGAILIDSNDNLFVCDSQYNCIREVYGVVTLMFHRQYVHLTLTASGGKYTGHGYSATATARNPSTGATIAGLAITITYYSGGTPIGATPPTDVGTYTAVASFDGTTTYAAAQSAPVTFTISRATPKITVSAITAAYDGNPHAATARMTGVNGVPADSLEGVAPTFIYYEGVGTGGASSTIAPSAVGTYTVVGVFAGSTSYTAVTSSQIVFKITAAPTPVMLAQRSSAPSTPAKIASTTTTTKSPGTAISTATSAAGAVSIRLTTSVTAPVTAKKATAAVNDAALLSLLKPKTTASIKVTTSVTAAKTVSTKLVGVKR